jgi:hypothetical protein
MGDLTATDTRDEAPGAYERRHEAIGVIPAVMACVAIMGALYLGAYVTYVKFYTGAM